MTSFENFLLLYDICFGRYFMLTGVWGGLFQQGLVFIFVFLASVLTVCGLLLLRCTFVFITALLLRGILYDFSYTCMARCLIFPFLFVSIFYFVVICYHLLFWLCFVQ